jgi:hypothetical protein
MSMALGTNSSSLQSAANLEKLLQTENISVTLKFGFQQKSFRYAVNEGSTLIVEKIYRDAETWLRSIAANCKNLSMVDRYTLYLFRIPTTDLTMVPIAQLSDIEQNSLIELVIVPMEINQNPHALYRCQLNIPTDCSKCSRLIIGLYRQGFRCRKCRMTYHKDCAPFLLDDCLTRTDPPSPTRKSSQPLFVIPIVSAPASSSNSSSDIANKTNVPIYTLSWHRCETNERTVVATTTIDEGIFPVCVRGTQIYRRYHFQLTSHTLQLTSNLSTLPTQQQQPQQARSLPDIDTVFPLADIANVVLTHFIDDRDYIFEIHFQGKFILCVGKKSDSDDLQMQTAQFYSSIRDQCEALLNGPLPVSPAPPSPTPSSSPGKNSNGIIRKKSVYRRPPLGRDNEDKDLHELYSFTGEKIGEGN